MTWRTSARSTCRRQTGGLAKGRRERAWYAYSTAVKSVTRPVMKPLVEPVARPLAREVTFDLIGFYRFGTCMARYEGSARLRDEPVGGASQAWPRRGGPLGAAAYGQSDPARG